MSAGLLIPGWDGILPSSVRTLVTMRDCPEGCSVAPYARFNLASHVGDDSLAVAANRQLLRRSLPAEPCWLNQVHGTRVVAAEHAEPNTDADACFSRSPNLVCAVLTADCLPVLLCAEDGSVVAAAHAGWRGLAAGVLEATVAAMNIPPKKLLAWLGPAIGATAFEVGDEVRAVFCRHDSRAEQAFMANGSGKWLCDLYLLARQRLAAMGVTRVSGGDLCTFSDARRFYSYRRDGVTGRMAALIWREA